jgi:long-chain fatty acid transport protein
MKTLKLFVALFVLVALPGAARAAGFAVDTQSARATGMASAMAADSGDASATFYNPAGLIGSRGLQIALGDTAIFPNVSATPTSLPGPGASTQAFSPPPHLLARYQITNDLAAGLGVFVPFGANTNWNWQNDVPGQIGQFQGTSSNINVWVVNPELAYKPIDGLRLGVGLQLAQASVVLKRSLGFVDSTGSVELGGTTSGTGFNVGLQAELIKNLLDFGISWRSSIGLNMAGKAHFDKIPDEFKSTLVDQTVNTSVTLPDVVYAGLGLQATKDLRLNFDWHYVHWKSFPSLDLNFQDNTLSSSTPKKWEDTMSFHVGGEYAISHAFKVRAGLAYDPTPSPSDTLTPDLPDANRMAAALGAGYAFGNAQLDLGYQFVVLPNMTSTAPTYPAKYSGNAQVVGLTFGWKMPQ